MGSEWQSSGKIYEVNLFVINGNSMVNHWENLNGIFHNSLLMGEQWNITGNILVVLISIQF